MNYQKQLLEILKKYTQEQTAQMLGISVRSIQNYISHGSMPLVSITQKINKLHTQLQNSPGDQAGGKQLL